MNKKLLNIFLFFFFSLVFFSRSNKIFASELIGTHLGEGDVETQISIIKDILVPNGLEPGSPVTVMVGINMLQPSQIGTVRGLAEAVKGAGFFPIVRINDVCNSVDGGSGITPVSAVQAAKTEFGDEALIVWGNEINNQENECNNWSKYVSDYQQIIDAGLSNVSPAALDYYMGNPEYTVDKFFSSVPEAANIFNRAPRVANAYGCVGSSEPDCTPSTTTTQRVGYSAISGTMYLTEFSLSPEGASANAPDTNIKKVLEFIESRSSETGAVKITPLVRNVCNNEGQWLLYINGKLFTIAGRDVSENCEGSINENTYDLDKYPEYGVIDELFFLTPIRSIIKGKTPDRTVANLREELASSGYESYCAAEGVKIGPEYDTKDLISKFVRQYPEGVNLKTESLEDLSFSEAEYPIWRDVSDKQFLMTSLEEYFGFKDVYETNPARSEITSAPINSLLSQQQACVQGWRNLVAQQITCEKLINSAECALLARPIPGTNYTVSTALDLLKEYDPNYRDGRAVVGCQNLTGASLQKEITLKKVLVNTPTYFDRAYRYGFVVAVIHTKEPGSSGGKAAKIFNFFTREADDEIPRDEVLVAAFKLPDIGTNKGGTEGLSGHQDWNDPLDLTRKVLTTREQQFNHEEKVDEKDENISRVEKRGEILTAAIGAEKQSEGSKIYCCSDGNKDCTTSCKNELPKALADLINGNVESCTQEPEAVKVIKDMAGLGNPEDTKGKIFKEDDFGGQTLLNLFDGSLYNYNDKYYDPQNAQTRIIGDSDSKIKTIWTVNSSTWGPNVDSTKVDFYVVYPVGFELNAVEEAMKGTFFNQKQIKTMNEDPTIVDNFELTGQKQGFSGGKVGWGFVDTAATEQGKCGVDPISLLNYPCDESVDIKIKQEGSGIGVLGGRLGWWLRKIQVALSAKTSFAYNYFLSCKTTEDFLLGRCNASFLQPDPNNPDGPPIIGDNLYCVNWIGLSSSQVDTYKQSMRDYLTGFEYTAGNQKDDYIAQLSSQVHFDWRGKLILPEETNFWENFYGGGRALLWTKNSACDGKACFDYVMDKCGEKGINPAICIGMSLTESGGLNHTRFQGTYDFGCLLASPNDINSGLDCLIDKFFFSDTSRGGKLIRDMNFNEMWLQFAGENFQSSSYGRLRDVLKNAGNVGYSEGDCQ